MSERIPGQEFTEKERELAEALRVNGPEHPETKEKLLEWLAEQERWAEEQNTSRANIEVDIRRARLYRAAGFTDYAWEMLSDIRRQANDENEKELLEIVEHLMDEMDQ